MRTDSMGIELSKGQHAVLAFILAHVDTGEQIETLSFRLAGSFDGTFHVAILHLGTDETGKVIHLLASIPIHSKGVFLGLSAGHEREVARMLSNLEDYERDTGTALYPLETVVTNDPSGIRALFLLHTVSHPALARIPDSAIIDSQEFRFSLAIGINSSAYDRKAAQGVDALLHLLESTDQSLVFFA